MSASLNSAGGTLVSADGKLQITVPEGALNALTTISIQPISNGAPGHAGVGYRLLPEGTTFARPVQLSFTYADADIAGSSADALGVATHQADGTWAWIDGTLNGAAHTVTANATHFSDWSLVKGVQLRPPSATVKTGGSVQLKLVYCFAPQTSGDLLVPLGFDCDNEGGPAPLNQARNWSVNGTLGGNGAVGTVSGNSASAIYTAPKQKPASNPVAVSAEVQNAKGKMLVISNITIKDDAVGYKGSISGTSKMPTQGMQISYQSGNLSFIPLEVLPGDMTKYVARGSLTMITRDADGNTSTQVLDLTGETGMLIVYDPVRSGTAFAGRYWFGLRGLVNACPAEVIAGGAGLPSYGADHTSLMGAREITCAESGESIGYSTQWDLKSSE